MKEPMALAAGVLTILQDREDCGRRACELPGSTNARPRLEMRQVFMVGPDGE